MYSDSREYGKVTEEVGALIIDRKENFQNISDNAKSINRFQLIVSGLVVSLTGFLINNEIIIAEDIVNSLYTVGATVSLSLAICFSFLIDHNARKRVGQQSELLFDDHLYNRYDTDSQLRERILQDRLREVILRWMESVSTAMTIIAIFLFLVGIFDIFYNPQPLIILILLLVLFGTTTFYLLSILGASSEMMLVEIIRFHQKEAIWERVAKKFR